jgi:hypothetical protein
MKISSLPNITITIIITRAGVTIITTTITTTDHRITSRRVDRIKKGSASGVAFSAHGWRAFSFAAR